MQNSLHHKPSHTTHLNLKGLILRTLIFLATTLGFSHTSKAQELADTLTSTSHSFKNKTSTITKSLSKKTLKRIKKNILLYEIPKVPSYRYRMRDSFEKKDYTNTAKYLIKGACYSPLINLFRYPKVFTLVRKQNITNEYDFKQTMSEGMETEADKQDFRPAYCLDFHINHEKWQEISNDKLFQHNIYPYFVKAKKDGEWEDENMMDIIQNGPDNLRIYIYQSIQNFKVGSPDMPRALNAIWRMNTINDSSSVETNFASDTSFGSSMQKKYTSKSMSGHIKINTQLGINGYGRLHTLIKDPEKKQFLLHTTYTLYAKNPNYGNNHTDKRFPDAEFPYMSLQLVPNREERNGTGYWQGERQITEGRGKQRRSSTDQYKKKFEEMLDTSTYKNKYRAEKDNSTNRSKGENVRNFKAYLSAEEVEEFTEEFMKESYISRSTGETHVNYNTEHVGYKNKEKPRVFNWGEFDDKFKNKMLRKIVSASDSTGETGKNEKEVSLDRERSEKIPYVKFIKNLLEKNNDNTEWGKGGSLDKYISENPRRIDKKKDKDENELDNIFGVIK